MKAQGYGRIVNIASVLSVMGRASIQPYTLSKHGIHGLTKGLATELGPCGITVNAIAPGYMETEMTKVLQENEGFNKFVLTRTPVGRWGTGTDLAGPVLLLVSGAGSYINGHMIVVDGGMTTALCDSLLT